MEWVQSTIGEVCDQGGGEVKTGPFGTQLHQSDYEEDGVPVVMPKDIIDGYVDVSTIARVSEEHVNRLSIHKLSEGDIVYGRRGDIGRQALVRKENVGWLCGTGCLRITLGNAPIDSYFLHLYLRLPEVIKWISNQAIGATMPNLNTSILREIPIRFPENKNYQKELADIISAYDNLIENNNRRIAILEEMAQSLYREWFVHYRFPGHEKAKFIDSPLGKIPEGWEIVKLGNVVYVKKGKNITKKTIKEGTVPVVAGGLTPAYYHNQANTHHPVITISASGVNAGFVNLYEEDVWASDCSYIDMNATDFVYYYYLLFKFRQLDITRMQRGSAQPHVYPKELMELEVCNIPKNIIDVFNHNIVSYFALRKNLTKKNKNIKKQRDLLLPKLISGDVML